MQVDPSGAAANDVDIDITAAADSSACGGGDLRPAPVILRREVVEYGSLPVATWLPRLDSPNALPGLLAALLGLASEADRPGGRRMVPLVAVADVLGTSLDHVQIIADVLDSVADEGDADLLESAAAETTTTTENGAEATPTTAAASSSSSSTQNITTPAVARSGPGAAGISAVDAHALALFLWVQLHLRAARRPETMDVWPPGPGERAPAGALEAAPGEPLSPRRVAAASAFASSEQQQHSQHHHHHHHHHHGSHSTVHVSHARTSPLARRELADHVAAARAARAGYLEHVRRSVPVLLALVADAPGAAAAEAVAPAAPLSSSEAAAMEGDGGGDGGDRAAGAAPSSSPPPPPSSAPPVPTHSAPAPPPPAELTAAEFDRLGLLLRPAAAGKWYRRRRRRRFAEREVVPAAAAAAAASAAANSSGGGETPMDEDLPPSSSDAAQIDEEGQRLQQRLERRRRRQDRPAPTLSSVAPGFDGSNNLSSAPTGPLAAWLRAAIGDDLSPSEALAWPVSSSSSGRAAPARGRPSSAAAASPASLSRPALLNGTSSSSPQQHTPTNAGAAAAAAALEAAAAAPPAGVLVSGFSPGDGGEGGEEAAKAAATPAAAPSPAAVAPLVPTAAAAAAAAKYPSSSDDDDDDDDYCEDDDDCEECDEDEAEALDIDGAALAPKGRRRKNLSLPRPPFAPSVVPGAVDVVGVCRSTVARGEASFPSGTLRVADCHDATIYALAPLDRAAIVACSDCTIVLGAVGRALRLERCERVHVVSAAARISVESCHDCVLSLGTNGRPLVLGSSRGLKFGPHCAGYARLRAHMALAGVTPEPNRWDAPCGVGREPVLAPPLPSPPPSPSSPSTASAAFASPFSSAAAAAAAAASSAACAAPASLLEPDKFAPLVIPFVGGPGPLCGGAALPDGSRLAADAGALLGLAPAAAAAAAAATTSHGQATGEGGGSAENANPTASSTASPAPSTPSSPTAAAAAAAAASARLAAASPFALPRRYAVARERKVSAIADLRSAVRRAALGERATAELQSSIQAHFKEWLASSGHMRHVYDLARLEREEASGGSSSGGGGGGRA